MNCEAYSGFYIVTLNKAPHYEYKSPGEVLKVKRGNPNFSGTAHVFRNESDEVFVVILLRFDVSADEVLKVFATYFAVSR